MIGYVSMNGIFSGKYP